MQLARVTETEWQPLDPAHFTGSGRVQRAALPATEPPVKVYRVEFQAAARTHWHQHSGVQLLFVVEGRCRFQKWGEAVQEAEAGDTICIQPNEKHWHGADPGAPMTHIAVNINAQTTWLERVTGEQYSSLPA